MLSTKPVGRGAAARKYDMITALGAYALSRDRTEQTLVLRFVTLVTSRYNWAQNLLAVGQREIARLWSVDERTVKREMAKLRARGWLIVRRQGTRGRVTEYGLDLDRILAETHGAWERIGPDFQLRLEGGAGDQVVPLPVRGEVPRPDVSGGSEWALARALLYEEDRGLYAAWLRALDRDARQGGALVLKAPSRFHAAYVAQHLEARLLAACRSVDDSVSEIRVVF